MSARTWAQTGTTLFLERLDGLSDADLDRPSALPDWSRRHLVAHVHFNAQALLRLVSWAATGAENRMYASPQQRAAEIDEGATWELGRLREAVRDSAERLEKAFGDLIPEQWQAQVITAQGRTVPTTEIPWMRAREVMIHALDLETGLAFDDLPGDFVAALLADVVSRRTVMGEGAGLASWLTGRAPHPPRLGPWL
jgi:maleylpyruvate isomerase